MSSWITEKTIYLLLITLTRCILDSQARVREIFRYPLSFRGFSRFFLQLKKRRMFMKQIFQLKKMLDSLEDPSRGFELQNVRLCKRNVHFQSIRSNKRNKNLIKDFKNFHSQKEEKKLKNSFRPKSIFFFKKEFYEKISQRSQGRERE